MADQLRIYPSGFRGSSLVKNTTPIDKELHRHRMFSASAIVQTEGRSASMPVCEIWETVSNGDQSVNTFEFHEQVLRIALNAFGTSFLYEWIVEQRRSPDWDEYHALWIDETLAFVFRGRPREFSVYNWTALLSAGSTPGSRNDSRLVQDLFVNQERLGDGYLISSFIHQWLQQPGGFEDLTNSLYVLFGKP